MCKYCGELQELAEKGEDALTDGFMSLAVQQISDIAIELKPLMANYRSENGRIPYEHAHVAHLCELVGMRLAAIYNRAVAGNMAERRMDEHPEESEAEIWQIASRGMAEMPPSMTIGIMAGEFMQMEAMKAMEEAVNEAIYGGLSMN